MEAVLHIEPITRKVEAPLHIGHNDFISYGEVPAKDISPNDFIMQGDILTALNEDIGAPASHMTLGCPLAVMDKGSNNTHIPLVKTFECTPDPLRDKGYVYSETLHYLTPAKLLIPYRTKIHSGIGQGLRLTHLPSLNLIRQDLTGDRLNVIDPRQEIVFDLMYKDPAFTRQRNLPLHDWLTEELTKFLSHYPVNELSFHKEPIMAMVHNYVNQVGQTSSELNSNNLRKIVQTITPPSNPVPSRYFSPRPIERHIGEFRQHCINSPVDFTASGNLDTETLDCLEYNSPDFKDICDFIDRLPLTDFNVDLVVNSHNEVEFYHEHVAVNRFNLFEDQQAFRYQRNDFMELFDFHFINDLLGKFVYFHGGITPEIIDIITNEPIKIKLIKTISDEAVVLLYRYNADSNGRPLCGAYFDLAVQSLSPLSIIPESVIN